MIFYLILWIYWILLFPKKKKKKLSIVANRVKQGLLNIISTNVQTGWLNLPIWQVLKLFLILCQMEDYHFHQSDLILWNTTEGREERSMGKSQRKKQSLKICLTQAGAKILRSHTLCTSVDSWLCQNLWH